VKILYFSWVRDRTGLGKEDITLPENVTTVEQLATLLRGKGDGYGEAFADLSIILAAVNQEHVKLDHPIVADDEVAFFPPVTGG
jgi:molybdopterin synthase sulfur carrier subunit